MTGLTFLWIWCNTVCSETRGGCLVIFFNMCCNIYSMHGTVGLCLFLPPNLPSFDLPWNPLVWFLQFKIYFSWLVLTILLQIFKKFCLIYSLLTDVFWWSPCIIPYVCCLFFFHHWQKYRFIFLLGMEGECGDSHPLSYRSVCFIVLFYTLAYFMKFIIFNVLQKVFYVLYRRRNLWHSE